MTEPSAANDGDPSTGPPSRPPRPRLLIGCLSLLAVVVVVCGTTAVVGPSLWYPLRVRLASLDGRVVLAPASGDAEGLDAAADVLRGRLRHRGVPARVARQGDRIEVEIPEDAVERTVPTLLARASLRFQLVADLPPAERADAVAAVRSAKAAGRYDPATARYDALPLAEDARAPTDSDVVLLERGGIGPGAVADAYRARDARGRPALGFELAEEGARRMRELTSANGGRHLAVVIDGTVRSAPQIRGTIGSRGVVDGGTDGWEEAELRRLLTVLEREPLPQRLEVVDDP